MGTPAPSLAVYKSNYARSVLRWEIPPRILWPSDRPTVCIIIKPCKLASLIPVKFQVASILINMGSYLLKYDTVSNNYLHLKRQNQWTRNAFLWVDLLGPVLPSVPEVQLRSIYIHGTLQVSQCLRPSVSICKHCKLNHGWINPTVSMHVPLSYSKSSCRA